MKAWLIASTMMHVVPELLDKIGYEFHAGELLDDYETDPDELAEFAGRACYQSWGRPNPETATNAGYLGNILNQRHYSVLEHASATFYLEDVSRSFTHELVRHRHMSFSQLSQRYVDESEAKLVFPPEGDDEEAAMIEEHMRQSQKLYKVIAERRVAQGQPRKQARGAARSVLPNATETRIVVTGNMRAWRELIQKRNTPQADAEFRQNAATLLDILKNVAPNTFQDM